MPFFVLCQFFENAGETFAYASSLIGGYVIIHYVSRLVLESTFGPLVEQMSLSSFLGFSLPQCLQLPYLPTFLLQLQPVPPPKSNKVPP